MLRLEFENDHTPKIREKSVLYGRILEIQQPLIGKPDVLVIFKDFRTVMYDPTNKVTRELSQEELQDFEGEYCNISKFTHFDEEFLVYLFMKNGKTLRVTIATYQPPLAEPNSHCIIL